MGDFDFNPRPGSRRGRDELNLNRGRVRTDDHSASIAGATSVAYRDGSQKARLLAAYRLSGSKGLTDEEAASLSGLVANRSCCWWKRCGELRADGYIELVEGQTRRGSAGVPRKVSRIVEGKS